MKKELKDKILKETIEALKLLEEAKNKLLHKVVEVLNNI